MRIFVFFLLSASLQLLASCANAEVNSDKIATDSIGRTDSSTRKLFLDTLSLVRNINPFLVSVLSRRLDYTKEEIESHYNRAPRPFAITEFSFLDSILTIKLVGVYSGGSQSDGNVVFRNDSMILYHWTNPFYEGVLAAYFKQELTYKIKTTPPKDTLVQIVDLNRFRRGTYMKSPVWDSVQRLTQPSAILNSFDASHILNRDSCNRLTSELVVANTLYSDSTLNITIEAKTRFSLAQGNAIVAGDKITLYYWSDIKFWNPQCARFRYSLNVPRGNYHIEIRELKM